MKLRTLLGHCLNLKKLMAFDFCNNYLKSYLMLDRTRGCFHICSLPGSDLKKLFLIFKTVFTLCFLSVGVNATDVGFKMETPADYLVSLVRHGERSPRDLGDMAQYWPKGAGQLTTGGLEQAYLLGKKIRQHYFSETLPDYWSPKVSRHYAKGLDRTIQSASALLQGIYPGRSRHAGLPGGIQLPPVYASPLASDDLFSAQRLCPGYLHRVQALEKSADWLRKKEQYRDQLSSWFELGEGDGVGNLYSLMPLIDQIAIHRMHRRPMPKGITIQEAIELEELLNWMVSRIFSDYEIAQLISTPLAKVMISDFKRVQKCLKNEGGGQSCQRWTLYSASDSNLLSMMTMLGAPSDRIVDYATHFGVQLNWNEGRPEIALSLNHEPFSVPGCVGHCSLDQWLVLLEQSLPDDWDYLCARDRGGFAPYPEPYVPSGSVASR